MFTLGSLFDGIGGWQLAARRAGIVPIWSSEIDRDLMAITKRHFPDTVQLGDINAISDPPHVDIVTASSPCQDLSIAGKRSGLHASRSGLFFKATELVRRIRPRFFVWENVTGAFSSNRGHDFRAVLEEILQEPVPLPRHWANAGVVDGRHCQIAWRTLDAQFWGVPQRRRRIFLIADFTRRRAAKILFEPASLPRHSPPCSKPQRPSAARTQTAANYSIGIGTWASTPTATHELTPTQRIGDAIGVAVFDNHWKDSRVIPVGDVASTVTAMYGTGGNNTPLVACNVVRRLTPVECERLQGLPDDWTAGLCDSKRYKALGNGLAQPCVDWILKRINDLA